MTARDEYWTVVWRMPDGTQRVSPLRWHTLTGVERAVEAGRRGGWAPIYRLHVRVRS